MINIYVLLNFLRNFGIKKKGGKTTKNDNFFFFWEVRVCRVCKMVVVEISLTRLNFFN